MLDRIKRWWWKRDDIHVTAVILTYAGEERTFEGVVNKGVFGMQEKTPPYRKLLTLDLRRLKHEREITVSYYVESFNDSPRL